MRCSKGTVLRKVIDSYVLEATATVEEVVAVASST
jgi:hypothetical protein